MHDGVAVAGTYIISWALENFNYQDPGIGVDGLHSELAVDSVAHAGIGIEFVGHSSKMRRFVLTMLCTVIQVGQIHMTLSSCSTR